MSRGHVVRPGIWIACEEKWGEIWQEIAGSGCSCIMGGRECELLLDKPVHTSKIFNSVNRLGSSPTFSADFNVF
jgi:hypothetical protein